MDSDKMTVEEQEKHVKENQRFNCHKIEHRGNDCRQKNLGSSLKTKTTSDEIKSNNKTSD